MATNLSIECADRSVRWYLTPGQSSRYEIIVINKSGDEHVDCTMSLDEPPEGATFEPVSFSLRPRERKAVALTFGENTQVPRDQLTVISVRDSAGDVMASLERGLISAGGIDCTIQLAWKEPILDGNAVRGFVVSCAIKSLSATAGHFALQYTPHPSLEFVDVAPIKLEPGQTQTVAVPILWKRTVKDADGNNHPRVVEVGVAVSQGKRTGRLTWEAVENKLAALVATAEPAASAAPPIDASAARSTQPAPPPQMAEPQLFSPITQGAPAGPAASPGDSPSSPAIAPPPTAPARPVLPPSTVAAAASSAPASSDATKPGAPPDFTAPENDAALMSLLVGKPVSPPDGWRGPGRDAPDAPTEPPSIFARTPAAVSRPPQPPPPQPPPPQPPPPQATPPAPPPLAQPASSVPQPYQPPRQPPQAPAAGTSSADAAPTPYRLVPTAAAQNGVQGDELPEPPQSVFGESPMEASVVGPPPSLARAIESGKEHTANARRTSQYSEPVHRSHEGHLGTLVGMGTGIIAIALATVFYLRPHTPTPTPQAQPSVTVPPAVVLETPRPTHSAARPTPGKNQPSPGASSAANAHNATPSAARVAVAATQQAVATNAPAPARTAAVAFAPKPVHTSAPRPRPVRRRPIPANPNVIVSVQGVDAHYGPGGHAIRVLWGANGQASAHVQLQDGHGGVLSQTDVNGGRQSAILYVPRAYRGSVFVQVVSVGAQGERVTQSTSLPAFSR